MLKLGHDGVSYSQESGGSQGLIGLAIDLSHHQPFLRYRIEENYSSDGVIEVHTIRHKALKKDVHPLHVWMRIVGQ